LIKFKLKPSSSKLSSISSSTLLDSSWIGIYSFGTSIDIDSSAITASSKFWPPKHGRDSFSSYSLLCYSNFYYMIYEFHIRKDFDFTLSFDFRGELFSEILLLKSSSGMSMGLLVFYHSFPFTNPKLASILFLTRYNSSLYFTSSSVKLAESWESSSSSLNLLSWFFSLDFYFFLLFIEFRPSSILCSKASIYYLEIFFEAWSPFELCPFITSQYI